MNLLINIPYMLLMLLLCINSHAKNKIILLDTGALESISDYTVGNEFHEMRIGAQIATEKVSKLHPNCSAILENQIQIENQGSFQKRLSIVLNAISEKQRTAVVGFSRSSNARTVAHMFNKSGILGISVGAAAELQPINSFFYSVASPITEQWASIKVIFSQMKCDKIYGIFPSLNGFSLKFHDFFQSEKIGSILSEDFKKNIFENDSCIFFGSNFSDSLKILLNVSKTTNVKKIIGTGDWSLSGNEVSSIVKKIDNGLEIWAPSGWPQDGYASIKKAELVLKGPLAKDLKSPSPILAYSYDATILATLSLCRGKNLSKLLRDKNLSDILIRDYSGVGKSGNLKSSFFVHKFFNKDKNDTN